MDGSKLNHQAAETYAKSFSLKICNQFFSENLGITGQQILSISPVKQINFFVLKALFAQWQEETKKFQSPFFNYKNEEVKGALKHLVNVLSKNIFIEKAAFLPLLEEAVLDTIFILCSPQDFYKREISKAPANQVKQSISGLSKYVKIRKDLFDAFVSSLNGNSNGADILGQLDSSIDSLEKSFPIAEDTLDATLNTLDGILPVSFIEQVESSSEVYVENEDTYTEPEKEQIEEPLITSGYEPLDDLNEDVPLIQEEIETRPVQAEVNTAPDETPEPEDRFNETDSLDQEFTPLDKPTSQPVVSELESQDDKSTTLNDQFSEELPTVNDQFEAETPAATVVQAHENKSISNLHGSININQRFMFLNDLFNGDVEEYENALIEVEMSTSFDDSVEILVQNYSRKYNWNMNSDEVKELLKVVFKKFR